MSILNGNEVPRMHSAEISWALRFHVNSTKKGPNNLSKSGQSSRSGPCGRSTPVNLNGKNRLENNIETSRHWQHFRFTTCVTSFVLVSAKLRRMRLCSAPCATSPETKRHYQCGMADQVRNAVDKTNKRLYGKRAASHFRDGPTSNHEEVKIAVCN
jgi:hypothetical protein